ncbi:MAG: cytochrome c biogenesis protein CcsA [Candidatus Omnitrophica bacterium]|nr:cytochrome c biogenesis protein CcsA [Candidatus Omnitrophota bacterium]
MIKKDENFFVSSKQWLGIAVASGLFCLIIRYRESGHLPMVNLFEITYFFAWTTSVLYFFVIKEKTPLFVGAAGLTAVNSLLVWTIFMDKNINPLNPLLDSFWLGIHVPAAMLSYGAFALSFGFSLYFIIAARTKWKTGSIPELNSFLIRSGTILLGICIVTGAVWANTAWGTYWSWDPKETWSLITFLIYGFSILLIKLFKIGHMWQAVLSVVGFLAVVFTFYGVSLILVSHHAYQ